MAAFNRGIDTKDSTAVVTILPELDIDLVYNDDGEQRMILNGSDVSVEIRRPEISMCASNVSAIAAVRDYLTDMQRNMAKRYDVIMDGRDIGTVILPNADVKVFLTASAEARADRRYKELIKKGSTVSYDEVLSDMKLRDEQDTKRAAAPLKAAEDAVYLDTSSMSFEESVDAVAKLIVEKRADSLLRSNKMEKVTVAKAQAFALA